MTAPKLSRLKGSRRPGWRLRHVLPYIARAYLSFALRTTQWRCVGPQSGLAILTQQPALTKDKAGALVVFWHQNLLLLPALWQWAKKINAALRLNVLISRNRDGRLISQTVAPWGIIGIEGSSNKGGRDKGGARALRAGVSALKKGALLAVTPDGPRGPARVAQEGVYALGRLSGRAAVPIGATCSAARLSTWDKMRIPLPFGRGYLCFGTPSSPGAPLHELITKVNEADTRANFLYGASSLRAADLVWIVMGQLLKPFLRHHLRHRLKIGKEDASRVGERFGLTALDRPAGDVLWFHAASVGETRSIFPLVARVLDHWPDINVVMTTATMTGAETVAHLKKTVPTECAQRLFHQYAPFDVSAWVNSFIVYWHPLLLLLTDSEVWPGWLQSCARRGIPTGVINARLSQKSYVRWRLFSPVAHTVFSRLAMVSARNTHDAKRFSKLGAQRVIVAGDLKELAPPLAFDKAALETLRGQLTGRRIFVAASTHLREEEIILQAVAPLRETHPSLLTIIIPRHPTRGEAIAKLSSPQTARRSNGEVPGQRESLWIADTLGEIGLFYELADMIFVGHSLLPPGGGHNPFEAMHCGAAVAAGPHVSNFSEAYARLSASITTVSSAGALQKWLQECLYRDRTKIENRPVQASSRANFDDLVHVLLQEIASMTGL